MGIRMAVSGNALNMTFALVCGLSSATAPGLLESPWRIGCRFAEFAISDSPSTSFSGDTYRQEPTTDQTAKSNRVEFAADTPFASVASRIIGTYVPNPHKQTPQSQAAAATRFLDSLGADLRKRAALELDDPERQQWTNLPARPDAGGIRLGLLNEDQLKAACDLLASLLSPSGYEKMRLIMLADDQLLSGNQPRPGFGSEYFSIVIFGEPSGTRKWGLQLDGHHLGLNLTVQGDRITMGPSFIGTQPVSFQLGGNRIRPMRPEADLAYQLVSQLSDQQFRKALVAEQRSQIRGGPGRDQFRPQPDGIAVEDLDLNQQSLLMQLIDAWISVLPARQAEIRLNQIKSELDQMYFSWHGPRQAGGDVSYMIQSPSLLIEFAYQDLGGDPLQHLHTQYRHLKNDYGTDFPSE
jgi:hypothetical protein